MYIGVKLIFFIQENNFDFFILNKKKGNVGDLDDDGE